MKKIGRIKDEQMLRAANTNQRRKVAAMLIKSKAAMFSDILAESERVAHVGIKDNVKKAMVKKACESFPAELMVEDADKVFKTAETILADIFNKAYAKHGEKLYNVKKTAALQMELARKVAGDAHSGAGEVFDRYETGNDRSAKGEKLQGGAMDGIANAIKDKDTKAEEGDNLPGYEDGVVADSFVAAMTEGGNEPAGGKLDGHEIKDPKTSTASLAEGVFRRLHAHMDRLDKQAKIDTSSLLTNDEEGGANAAASRSMEKDIDNNDDPSGKAKKNVGSDMDALADEAEKMLADALEEDGESADYASEISAVQPIKDVPKDKKDDISQPKKASAKIAGSYVEQLLRRRV